MKQKSIFISFYAALILIGGIIGYSVANSVVSLVVSALFAFLLWSCAALMWKGYSPALPAALVTIFSLFLFFSARYFITYKLAPSGIMAFVSALVFFTLLFWKEKTCCIAETKS